MPLIVLFRIYIDVGVSYENTAICGETGCQGLHARSVGDERLGQTADIVDVSFCQHIQKFVAVAFGKNTAPVHRLPKLLRKIDGQPAQTAFRVVGVAEGNGGTRPHDSYAQRGVVRPGGRAKRNKTEKGRNYAEKAAEYRLLAHLVFLGRRVVLMVLSTGLFLSRCEVCLTRITACCKAGLTGS